MLSRLAHVSRDAIIYGISGTLARFSGLILLPLYTNFFSREGSGIFQSVTNLGALLLAIGVLGLDGASSILYFAAEDASSKRLICTIWTYTSFLISLPITAVLILGADWLSWVTTGTPQYAHLFRLGVAVLPFSLLLFTSNSILRFMFKARTYALLNLGLTILVSGIIVYLVAVARWGLEGALWGTLIGSALLTVPAVWAIKDNVAVSTLRRGAGRNPQECSNSGCRSCLPALRSGSPISPAPTSAPVGRCRIGRCVSHWCSTGCHSQSSHLGIPASMGALRPFYCP